MELFLEPVGEVAGAILASLLMLAAALGLRYANQYLKLGVLEKQQRTLEALALEAVQAVAQTSAADASNAAKKNRALNQVVEKAATAGVKVARDKADDLVEAAVHKLRKWM